MIHFDFVVSDVEAEEIMSAIHNQILNCHKGIIDSWGTGGHEDAAKRAWFDARIKYLEELKKKMTNRRLLDEN